MAMRTAEPAPGSVSELRLARNEYRCIAIEWSAPETDGTPLEGFVLKWGVEGQSDSEHEQVEVPVARPDAESPFVAIVTTAPPGVLLSFSVAPRTRVGMGPFTARPLTVRSLCGVPDQPPSPTVTLRTQTSIQISVKDTSWNNGSPIVRYEARYDMRGNMWNATPFRGALRLVPDTRPNALRVYESEVTGLKERGPYFFSVRAVNSVGCSEWSEPSPPQFLFREGPSRMSAPYLVEAEHDALVVGYTPPVELGVRMGGGLYEYEMRWARRSELLEKADGGGAEAETVGGGVSYMAWEAPPHGAGLPEPRRVAGLLPGRSYFFQVRPLSDLGAAPWSCVSEPFKVLASRPDRPEPPTMSQDNKDPFCVEVVLTLPESNGAPIDSCDLRFCGPLWEDKASNTAWQDLPAGTLFYRDVHVVQRKRPVPLEHASDPDSEVEWHYAVLHLAGGGQYQFMFKCKSEMGESEWSEPSVLMRARPKEPDQ